MVTHLSTVVLFAFVVNILNDVTEGFEFWNHEVCGEGASNENNVVLDAPGGQIKVI
jgi:hypothetical protein